MKKTLKRLLLVTVMALAGIVAAQTHAEAQFTYRCVVINGCWCYIIIDPCGRIVAINCNCGGRGSATFNSAQPILPAGPLNVNLSPTDLQASVQDPQLGTINTTLDATRTAELTTIRSNDQSQRFPATGDIRFYANATVATAPGIVYASKTPVHLNSGNLNSVNPFNNETFTLTEDVEFYNTADLTQQTAFRLQGNTSTTTLGSDQQNGVH
ncbi:MAG TPA: hypothetical protein VHI13_01765 [Candidatus Kapabacteria bacterium]|nr:hypothetical protein [Candidatus Kapabacteria bacterium]